MGAYLESIGEMANPTAVTIGMGEHHYLLGQGCCVRQLPKM